jgi:hypothetical protein
MPAVARRPRERVAREAEEHDASAAAAAAVVLEDFVFAAAR